MPTNDTIYFFAPVSAFRKRTRLAKMAKIFLSYGYRLRFHGWERESGEAQVFQWDGAGVEEQILLRGGGHANLLARLLYPVWMILVFLAVLRVPTGSICFCLGWETAFPARLASYISGARVVFDDADRFSMVIRLPKLLHRLIVALERWTSRVCALHLIPGWGRYEWRHENMMVIRNSPLSEDYRSASSADVVRPDADLVLYVNGWIAWDTGSRIILEALRKLDRTEITYRVIVAGRVVSKEGKALARHAKALFYGELSQERALALYRASDVVFTLYDPAVSINHFAESNKWGDCVFLETPFIVNSEVKTASEFVKAGAALAVPYHEVDELAELLVSIAKDKTLLQRCRTNLKRFSSEYRPYDVQFEELISLLRSRFRGS